MQRDNASAIIEKITLAITIAKQLADQQWLLLTNQLDRPTKQMVDARIEASQFILNALYQIRTQARLMHLPVNFLDKFQNDLSQFAKNDLLTEFLNSYVPVQNTLREIIPLIRGEYVPIKHNYILKLGDFFFPYLPRSPFSSTEKNDQFLEFLTLWQKGQLLQSNNASKLDQEVRNKLLTYAISKPDALAVKFFLSRGYSIPQGDQTFPAKDLLGVYFLGLGHRGPMETAQLDVAYELWQAGGEINQEADGKPLWYWVFLNKNSTGLMWLMAAGVECETKDSLPVDEFYSNMISFGKALNKIFSHTQEEKANYSIHLDLNSTYSKILFYKLDFLLKGAIPDYLSPTLRLSLLQQILKLNSIDPKKSPAYDVFMQLCSEFAADKNPFARLFYHQAQGDNAEFDWPFVPNTDKKLTSDLISPNADQVALAKSDIQDYDYLLMNTFLALDKPFEDIERSLNRVEADNHYALARVFEDVALYADLDENEQDKFLQASIRHYQLVSNYRDAKLRTDDNTLTLAKKQTKATSTDLFKVDLQKADREKINLPFGKHRKPR